MEIIIHSPTTAILFSNSFTEFRYYGLIMSISIVVGIIGVFILFKKSCGKNVADLFLDDSIFIVFLSILGARLFYVFANFSYYLSNPKEIILINHGGISIWGAIIFGIISIYFISKKRNIATLKYFDIVSILMPLCQSIGRWGNYFNQEAFGKPTTGFIKLFVDKSFRPEIYKNFDYFHPTFLYESLLNFILFVILFLMFKTKKHRQGKIFCFYLMGYSIIRMIVEPIRVDATFYIFGIPIAQFISFFVFMFAIFYFIKIKKAE